MWDWRSRLKLEEGSEVGVHVEEDACAVVARSSDVGECLDRLDNEHGVVAMVSDWAPGANTKLTLEPSAVKWSVLCGAVGWGVDVRFVALPESV